MLQDDSRKFQPQGVSLLIALISVLMPALNSETTIEKAMRSTLKSLGSEDELLVFNDGSSDETLNVALAVKDPRVRVFSDEATLGIVTRLNFLITVARGDLIARMDSDDICFRHRFALQRLFIRLGYDVVFSNALLFWGGRRRFVFLPYPWFWIGSRNFARFSSLCNFGIHPTALGHAEVFRHLGYRQMPDEDHDLWKRAVSEGYKLTRVSIPTVALRQHANQITKSAEWNRLMTKAKLAEPSRQSKKALPLWLRIEIQGPRQIIKTFLPNG